jgi:hypothetical protein
VRRREFISLIGTAAAWPLAARAQQGEPVRRIGVLLPATADDAEFQARVGAFLQGLQQMGLAQSLGGWLLAMCTWLCIGAACAGAFVRGLLVLMAMPPAHGP